MSNLMLLAYNKGVQLCMKVPKLNLMMIAKKTQIELYVYSNVIYYWIKIVCTSSTCIYKNRETVLSQPGWLEPAISIYSESIVSWSVIKSSTR